MIPFRSSLFALVALLLAFASPALAQQAAAPEASAGSSSSQQIERANEALIKVLNDPESRAAFLELLKKSASDGQVGDANATAASETPGQDQAQPALQENFALRVGEYTRTLVDDTGYLLEQAMRSLNGLVLVARGEIPIKWDRAREIVVQVIFVLIAAYAGFLLSQVAAKLLYPRMSVYARYGGGFMRAFILILTSVVDGITVGIGWAVGNGAALLSYGGFDSGVTLQESLALNAFFIVGVALVALRFIFAPGRPELRLLPFTDESSLYWYRRLRLFMYWLIYGVFLAVPIANVAVSFVLGNALRFIVVLLGMIYLVVLVLRNRQRVHDGANDYAQHLQSALARKALAVAGRLWHLAALGYVAAVFIIWVTRPFDATTIIIRATGLSILTIMGGMVISLVMTKAIKGGIRLPEELNKTLPALQHRLNAFVPRLLKIIRFAVFLVTVLLLFEIWGVLGLLDWLASEAGVQLLSNYGSAFLVLLVAFTVWLAVMSWVDLRLQARSGYIVTARERTLFQLFRNASTVVIIVMATLLALSEIGVDIGPLIAGAGVVGLAISFGAQTLVKDIITGAFIQIENAINEGDVVTVAGITGTVEGLTVRSVRMRDIDGTTHIIPFSSVDMVSNFMRGFSYHVALIGVSYDTSISEAKDAMLEAFRRLQETEFGPKIIGEFEMHGVTNFGASSIDIRGRIKTLPGDQWSVGRAYNEFVKQVFDERNIEIPFPQVTYHAATPPFVEGQAKAKQRKDLPSSATEIADDAPADDGEN
ncbi:mechanosensitive ion channel domain-containing protein [Roseibium sediminicola]|uniref:Mechanosensitive ion channel n=1 Tax=Roseibium sediminicola TaxID=2933272 RepID=A0ABT0GVH0_9HYPH|nr:mechanosensitive ion channel domain-containing protein [Roseibium sp. CAU 1639]MCK7613215.1 mechanosensitive ion channel [Roseibium sp. CAU 1639]